jgi:hypothetical protein
MSTTEVRPCPFCGGPANIQEDSFLPKRVYIGCSACAIYTDYLSPGQARAAWNRRPTAQPDPTRPRIVCLCGSTRFWRTFQEAGLKETLAGRIVLSIGAASGTDDEHFGNLPREEYDAVKEMLDQLHFRKIELADEVLVLNVDGYVGLSTAREMNYALKLGKSVRFWEANGHRAEVQSAADLDAYICLGCRRLLPVTVGFMASWESPKGYLMGGWYCHSCIRRGKQGEEAKGRLGNTEEEK